MNYIILVDNREKIPLLFPSHIVMLCRNCVPHARKARTIQVTTEPAHLKTGDYALQGNLARILVERKRDFSELARNCLTLDGRRKFSDECKRLANECDHPVLLVEGSIPQLLRTYRPYTNESPWLAVDAYQRLCLEWGIETVYLPSSSTAQRRVVGEFIAHLLINGAHTHGRIRHNLHGSSVPAGGAAD